MAYLRCAAFSFCLSVIIALPLVAGPAFAAPAAGTAGGTTTRAAAAPAATDKRSRAIALYNAKDYRGAAQLLDEYMVANPRDAAAAYYAAISYQWLGNSRKAIVYYRTAYTIDPNSAYAANSKAVLMKLDPTFADTQAAAAVNAAAAAAAKDNSAPASVPTLANLNSPEEEMDPSLPKECRVRFEKGLPHIYLDAYIENRPIKLMLDTGAPTTTVGKNQLNIRTEDKPQGYTGGSSSNAAAAMWMKTCTIKVGQIERKHSPIMVMAYNSASPLLGQSFFKGYDYTIDTGAGEVVFRQKSLTAKNGAIRNSESVPFTFREKGSRIIVQVEVNGKKGPMIFDTGNTASAISFKSFGEAESFGVKVPDDAVRTRHLGVNGVGNALNFPVNRVKFGPFDKTYVEVSVNEGTTSPDGLPLLGQPFWQGYEYTIDMDKKLIHFVRR